MLKLTKICPSEWLGNGMGATAAEWKVKGHEHIQLRQIGIGWSAFDIKQKFIAHYLNDVPIIRSKRIATADTKRDLLEILSTKLETANGCE